MVAIWRAVQCSSHLLTSWKVNESLGGNYLGFCETSENPPEVSWNKTWQKLSLIVKKRWQSIVTFWKNVFASCWILDSVLTSVVDFGNFLAPSTSAFYPFSPATPCMTIFIYRGILVIMVMSVILWHEKTKIRKIIGFGNFDVISVKTIIHNNNKKMGHLILPLGVYIHAISWKWDVTRWHKASWMIVVTCQTRFFCHIGTISAQ